MKASTSFRMDRPAGKEAGEEEEEVGDSEAAAGDAAAAAREAGSAAAAMLEGCDGGGCRGC